MIALRGRSHTPIEPRAKVVLQCGSPSRQGIIAVRAAVPGVALIGPIVMSAWKFFMRTIAPRPASPIRLLRLIHACGHEVEKCHGIPFLLTMRGVRGIKRPERPMTLDQVTLQIESAGGGGERGKTVIPSLAIGRRLEGVHPKSEGWLKGGGVLFKFIGRGEAQFRFEARIALRAAFPQDPIERTLQIVGPGSVVRAPIRIPER